MRKSFLAVVFCINSFALQDFASYYAGSLDSFYCTKGLCAFTLKSSDGQLQSLKTSAYNASAFKGYVKGDIVKARCMGTVDCSVSIERMPPIWHSGQ